MTRRQADRHPARGGARREPIGGQELQVPARTTQSTTLKSTGMPSRRSTKRRAGASRSSTRPPVATGRHMSSPRRIGESLRGREPARPSRRPRAASVRSARRGGRRRGSVVTVVSGAPAARERLYRGASAHRLAFATSRRQVTGLVISVESRVLLPTDRPRLINQCRSSRRALVESGSTTRPETSWSSIRQPQASFMVTFAPGVGRTASRQRCNAPCDRLEW